MARTRAPLNATEDLFRGNPNASFVGALAVGVFGELKGYELILNVTGSRVPWPVLFEEAIDLAERGIEIDTIMASKINATWADADDALRKHLIDKKTMRLLGIGDIYTNKELASTLRKIANSTKRGRYFDSGQDIEDMVKELRSSGGVQTTRDFETFEVEAASPAMVELQEGERLFTTPPPASGAVLAFVVKVMDSFRTDGVLADSEENAHRLVEAIKFGFARRSDIGDPGAPEVKESVKKALDRLLNPEAASAARKKITDKPHNRAYYGPEGDPRADHGTGIVSIVAPDGDAISIASTLNTEF
ncbi:scoloptoxin SSD14-like [Haemaphysalis longicornis]